MQKQVILKTNTNLDLISKKQVDLLNLNSEVRKEFEISYISDIHLEARFRANNCQTQEDKIEVIKNIRRKFFAAKDVILIAGDTTAKPSLFEWFFRNLCLISAPVFVTLGNHELFNFYESDLQQITEFYKSKLGHKQYLVQNNIYVLTLDGVKEISEFELKNISDKELISKAENAYLIIFGGIGFSGRNQDWNALNKIYGPKINLSRQKEIELTNEFYFLYKKVARTLKGKRVIVLTHMPVDCWLDKETDLVDSFIYVNGHTHKNNIEINNRWAIIADNQVGYGKRKKDTIKTDFGPKSINFKHFYFKKEIFNCFAQYEDGIYEITAEQHKKFRQYIRMLLEPNFNLFNFTFVFVPEIKREYLSLFLVKKNGYYAFFLKTKKGKLFILNGLELNKIPDKPLEYFYENVDIFAKKSQLIFKEYYIILKNISDLISSIGGDGRIHGSIIDINFFTHIYINPYDGKVTAYLADDMVNKYVYSNIVKLFADLPRLVEKNNCGAVPINKIIRSTKNNKITLVTDTKIYKVSKYFLKLQKIITSKVVGVWNESIANEQNPHPIKYNEKNFEGLLNGLSPFLISQNQIKKSKNKKINRYIFLVYFSWLILPIIFCIFLIKTIAKLLKFFKSII